MPEYKVRSGQNLYDIALTLHGSVEGIFDLLASNNWLTMETKLQYGMVLTYHEGFVIDDKVRIWLRENNILVKNGEHICSDSEISDVVKKHIESNHPDIIESLEDYSADEQSLFWESLYTPRMIIRQDGILCNFKVQLKNETHLIIDWGDFSSLQLIEGSELNEIEHCYKGNGPHTIILYGNCEFGTLDFSSLIGIYYPLGIIYADNFISKNDDPILNKLIITI